MSEISIRISGRAGRITLTRDRALNAMSYAMCRQIAAALDDWRRDPAVDLVIFDAEGDRAFCAGGDIAELYDRGTRGDFAYGQTFWRDEYRMNALIAEYPKPVVALMQGFTMGGGVGLGCHASHRVVCTSSRIAMPECGIGLVPDVGGSYLLARAPGHLGDYLGLAAARMGPGDAILAGFADHFIPQDQWPALVSALEGDADLSAIQLMRTHPPESGMAAHLPEIEDLFSPEALERIVARLDASDTLFAQQTRAKLASNAPLSMACTLEMLRRLRAGVPDIGTALELEYRFTHRAMEKGDFLEGIRAAIIDKDRAPVWRHSLRNVPRDAVEEMLAPLGADALTFQQETTE